MVFITPYKVNFIFYFLFLFVIRHFSHVSPRLSTFTQQGFGLNFDCGFLDLDLGFGTPIGSILGKDHFENWKIFHFGLHFRLNFGLDFGLKLGQIPNARVFPIREMIFPFISRQFIVMIIRTGISSFADRMVKKGTGMLKLEWLPQIRNENMFASTFIVLFRTKTLVEIPTGRARFLIQFMLSMSVQALISKGTMRVFLKIRTQLSLVQFRNRCSLGSNRGNGLWNSFHGSLGRLGYTNNSFGQHVEGIAASHFSELDT